MEEELKFVAFPKIARYSREVVVTEKIDGSNAFILIGASGEFLTGSRHKWITPDNDNFGFSAWAHANKEELLKLGQGRHFGEWWGHGIQRNYGLPRGDRRFSLFNITRWCLHGQTPQPISTDGKTVKMQDILPACVGLVPIIWRGRFDMLDAGKILMDLRHGGSHVIPGFMNPEGIVIFHTAANVCFKKTFDDEPKSATRVE